MKKIIFKPKRNVTPVRIKISQMQTENNEKRIFLHSHYWLKRFKKIASDAVFKKKGRATRFIASKDKKKDVEGKRGFKFNLHWGLSNWKKKSSRLKITTNRQWFEWQAINSAIILTSQGHIHLIIYVVAKYSCNFTGISVWQWIDIFLPFRPLALCTALSRRRLIIDSTF